jgi:membrane protease YdiL (CAAX protease family)
MMKTPYRAVKAVTVSLLYLLLCALLATGLAYPLHHVSGGGIDFRVAVTRGSLITAILGTGFWIRRLQLDYDSLGLAGSRKGRLTAVGQGLASGIVMLGLHCLILVSLGVRELDMQALGSVRRVMTGLMQAAGIGLVVATIEECLFRGVLLAALRRSAGTFVAVLFSALYYAILHFFRVNRNLDLPDPSVYSSFAVLAQALKPVFMPPVGPSLALFFAGLFLALVRLYRPHGLACCIGIHAGWIFVIKSCKTFTDARPLNEWAFLAGSYDGFTGFLAAGWMAALTLALAGWLYRQRRVIS